LIQQFRPEKYFVVTVRFSRSSEGPEYQGLPGEWYRGRVFDKHVGARFLQLVNEHKADAKCISIESVQKSKSRPLPLNTVALLKIGSAQLGMGPQQVMRVAEGLYIQGFISYPRTETSGSH
jgi:DNA topoisomerase-3